MTTLPTHVASRRDPPRPGTAAPEPLEVLSQDLFRRMIALERKRTERTNVPFLLLLLEAEQTPGLGAIEESLRLIASSLSVSIRETDVIGWHQERMALGVMFTGLQIKDKDLITSLILNRVHTILQKDKLSEHLSNLKLSFFFSPMIGKTLTPACRSDRPSILTCSAPAGRTILHGIIKRVMDVAGSACLLICLSPIFAAVALAEKAHQRGRGLFKQERVGQYGNASPFSSLINGVEEPS